MSKKLVPGNSSDLGKSQFLVYEAEDGRVKIDVRLENETVWLTQQLMADLFQRERSVITKHLRNVFREGELDEKSNVQKMHIPGSDKPIAFFNPISAQSRFR